MQQSPLINMGESESNTDSTRKLASIQIVEKVVKHPDADTLSLATVLGWQVVIRNDEAKENDLIIYCEIDSLLPGNAEWLPDAIKTRVAAQTDQTFFRVKTIKLRKELSQGLIVPIPKDWDINSLNIGDNVTEKLCIKKYEPNVNDPQIPGAPKESTFPSHILDKTDETRVQSAPKLFKALQGKPYYITVKCDGMSGTYVIDPETNEFLVCSRNTIKKIDPKVVCHYNLLAQKYNIEEKLRMFPHLALQGEVCGPSIQKNLLGLKEVDFFVFNVIDIKHRCLLPLPEMLSVCKELGLKFVPIVEQSDSFAYTDIKELLVKAEGKYPNTKNEREGIVVRSLVVEDKISFKVINNAYLIKNDY